MHVQNLLQADIFLQVVTSGRLVSILSGVVGLISLITGCMAYARAGRRIASARPLAMACLAMGWLAIVACVIHLATAKGDFGTGSGRLGAIVALVIAGTGTILGWLTFSRIRRMAMGSNHAGSGESIQYHTSEKR